MPGSENPYQPLIFRSRDETAPPLLSQIKKRPGTERPGPLAPGKTQLFTRATANISRPRRGSKRFFGDPHLRTRFGVGILIHPRERQPELFFWLVGTDEGVEHRARDADRQCPQERRYESGDSEAEPELSR